MRRVLHLITGLERAGGAENMLAKTLPYLKNTENIVCVLKGKGDIGNDLEMKGIKVYSLGMNSPLDIFKAIQRYREIVLGEEPDIQVNYLIHADIFGRIFAKRYGVKTLVSYIRNRHVKKFFTFLDKITLGRVDHLLTNSESVLSFYRQKYNFPQDRSDVIPNGVFIPEEELNFDKQVLKKELGIEEGQRVISCVASLIPQKDHTTLLKAIKIIKDKGKRDIKVLLAGEGSELDNLRGLSQELDIADQIKFLGKRDDVEEILSISDLFVLPSLHEGMSNALLEAMLYRVPAVVSSIPENKELIEHNENGLVFNVGDPESLSESLFIALEDPQKMQELSARSRKLIEDKYDIKKTIDELDFFLLSDLSPKKKVKVIYIAGAGHSGSTLLERIIGTSKNTFSVGELKFLKQFIDLYDPGRPYREPERFVDASGKKLTDSFFWGDIIKQIQDNKYQVYDRYHKIDKKISISILFGQPFLHKKFNDLEILELILKKAKEVKGDEVEYIIDSSKSLKRLISLKQDDRIDLYVIHNTRDVRGLICSREKRAMDWLKIFFSWLKTNFLISVFLGRFVEKEKIITIGYDDFASDPEKYIRETNKKFGLKISEDTYVEDVNSEESYVFAGNIMRSRKFGGIIHDEKWKYKFPGWKKKILGILSSIPNQIWVYRDK